MKGKTEFRIRKINIIPANSPSLAKSPFLSYNEMNMLFEKRNENGEVDKPVRAFGL